MLPSCGGMNDGMVPLTFATKLSTPPAIFCSPARKKNNPSGTRASSNPRLTGAEQTTRVGTVSLMMRILFLLTQLATARFGGFEGIDDDLLEILSFHVRDRRVRCPAR